MRNIRSCLIVLMLIFVLSACSISKKNPDMMNIKSSKFSEETKQILELIDEDIKFYDFFVDDTIKSFAINVSIYQNEEWLDQEVLSENIYKTDNRISMQMTEKGYIVSLLNNDGFTKYASPELALGFDNIAQQFITTQILDTANIVVDEEITLWIKIGNDKEKIIISPDFRKSDCTEGIAFTIIFSNNKL